MTADTALTGEVIEEISRAISAVLSEGNITFRAGDLIWNQSLARAIEQAVLQSPEVQALRDALEDVSQWMDSQADAQSKGGHATFDIMMLREKRDIARSALAAMEKNL